MKRYAIIQTTPSGYQAVIASFDLLREAREALKQFRMQYLTCTYKLEAYCL